MFSEETRSNNGIEALSNASSKYHYPYMMQYQFIGGRDSSGKSVPSFSTEKPVPADIRFIYHLYQVGSWGLLEGRDNLLEIRSPWDPSLLTKRNFKGYDDRYSSIRFDFTYAHATNAHAEYSNISVTASAPPQVQVSGFSIRLSDATGCLKIGSPGYFFYFQKKGSVAFVFQHRQLSGHLPPHIYRYFNYFSHWEA